ncbi:CPBP family intramembrane glutamic endopeptidase [Lactobacillus rizhaonensis]|uniref:CPBP family intramembrane glutamic endopeptidase n=1 Tax=Lactobacillus rizhaonensis TaxID=3082863 RepID=UPI003B980EBE
MAAGIAEEWLMRFCVLSILLKLLQNSRYQIIGAVLLDGLIFGILHIANLIEQPIPATIYK